MRIRIAVPEAYVSPPVVDAALEAVTRLDEHMIRAGHSPTSHDLVKQGAIWRPEDPGDEHFDHGGTIAKRGWGDCDDWAPLHAATLRASGEDAGAVARVVPSGPNTYHAIVQRSDGSIDDPSVAAGMKAHRVSGAELDPEHIQVWACDPHDGRIYQGQLLPAVGPLSLHCGPGFAVRGVSVVGQGTVYEARCDIPIGGSPLVHVHSYWRRRAHHRRHRVAGAVPYAISCTSHGLTPLQALNGAMCGAIMLGDAAELNTSVDRYKLLAVQAAMSGASPGQVRDALVAQMTHDMQQVAEATGTHPQQHTQALLAQLAAESGGRPIVVGDFFSDIGHAAAAVVSTVSDVANTVSKAVSSVPWGDIIHGVEAAVSAVPGIGTAVSDVLATAETAYDAAAAALSGNPLLGAIDAAYNYALASVPGAAALHYVLDPIKTTLEALAIKKEPIESAVLDGILAAVPDNPKFGPISPKSIAQTIAHLLVGHLGMKNTGRAPAGPIQPLFGLPIPVTPAMLQAAQASRPRTVHRSMAYKPPPPPPKPVALRIPPHMVLPAIKVAPKPPGVPHAAMHVTLAPKTPAPTGPRPGSPGAPPGATHWTCTPLPGGQWQCQWR